MAKDANKAGKQRDELKAALPLPGDESKGKLDKTGEALMPVPYEEFEKKAPKGSAHKTIEDAADKGEVVTSSSGDTKVFEPETISKPEAELLVRKFTKLKKGTVLPMDETMSEVKVRNEELRKEKAKRSQQNTRIIANLRRLDPKGKRTCGRCARRVKANTMDSKKELCEVCSS